MNAIEVERLTKMYGDRRGIVDATFDVPAGSLFGFIGPNGAGKTTTMRVLLGLLAPTAGSARLFGIDCRQPRARAAVGYAPGETHLVPGMRAGELLRYLGSFQPGDHAGRCTELATLFDLDLRAPTDDLSLGTKKKVAIIAALQTAPRLIVLDEPTSALDPVVRAHLFDVLRDAVAGGATVLMSSHVLSEVEALCKTVAIVNDGRIVAVDDIATFRDRAVRTVIASFDGGGESRALAGLVRRLDGVTAFEQHGATIRFGYRGPMPPLLDALAAAAPSDVRVEAPSLEDIFLEDFTARKDHRAA